MNKQMAKEGIQRRATTIGFVEALTLVFITLKLTNVIEWSWWWVLSPMITIWSLMALLLAVWGLLIYLHFGELK